MKLAFWIVMILLLASGFGAYIGDQLGRRIGKKKVSIFSLRPKHTSTLLTILLSMSIALGFLGILLGVSEEARQALFYPSQPIQSEQYQYTQHLHQVNRSLQRIQRKLNPSSQPPNLIEQQQIARVSLTKHAIDSQVNTSKKHRLPAQKTTSRQIKSLFYKDHVPLIKNEHIQKNSQSFMLKKGELLFSFEIEAQQASDTADAIVNRVLQATGQYAKELGAGEKDKAYIQILSQDIDSTLHQLKAGQPVALKVTVANNTLENQPVSIRLNAQSKQAFHPHDVLERERLKGEATHQDLAHELDQTIVKTVQEHQQWGVNEAVGYTFQPPPLSRLEPNVTKVTIKPLFTDNKAVYGAIQVTTKTEPNNKAKN